MNPAPRKITLLNLIRMAGKYVDRPAEACADPNTVELARCIAKPDDHKVMAQKIVGMTSSGWVADFDESGFHEAARDWAFGVLGREADEGVAETAEVLDRMAALVTIPDDFGVRYAEQLLGRPFEADKAGQFWVDFNAAYRYAEAAALVKARARALAELTGAKP